MSDPDPVVEPTLDRFSRVLPLPYRVAFIIVLGMITVDLDWNPAWTTDNVVQASGPGA